MYANKKCGYLQTKRQGPETQCKNKHGFLFRIKQTHNCHTTETKKSDWLQTNTGKVKAEINQLNASHAT